MYMHLFLYLWYLPEKAKFHNKKTYNILFINIRTQPSVICMYICWKNIVRSLASRLDVKEFQFNRSSFDNTYVLKVPKRMDVLFWDDVCYMGIYNYLFREKDYVGPTALPSVTFHR